jgi:very-short-patch-repair endonuclease
LADVKLRKSIYSGYAISREWLVKEYVVKGKSIAKISEETGMGKSTISNHLRKNSIRIRGFRESPSTASAKSFLERAKSAHGDKYDYSKALYINSHTKVKMICWTHGEFDITPTDLCSHKHGCPRCAYESRMLTTEEFVRRSKEIHGDKYEYEEVAYQGYYKPVLVKCKIHGAFSVAAGRHLYGDGCPKCRRSKSEAKIARWLEKNNITFEEQKRFGGLKRCPFDFWIPSLNTVIEYQGEQHFVEESFFNKRDGLRRRKILDETKATFCKSNSITLVEIRFTQNIEKALVKLLGMSCT